jgi:phosphoribosylamine--glycine ligase
MAAKRKVLVVGSGGREHALALRLLESPSVAEVLVAPGNAGTLKPPPDLASKRLVGVAGSALEIAVRERPDLVVIGPEGPLCAGLVDELTAAGFLAYGPTRSAAALEGSKAFMKDFANRHGILTARHRVVRSASELDAALADFSEPPVVKADGLCSGKGVVVADSHDEARSAALDMLSGQRFGQAGQTLVLEQRLRGPEASVHAICDGERFFVLPAAQDHKRIGDGDRGPNTGGMGAYAPAPVVSPELSDYIANRVFAPTLRGMAAEGRPFRGTLYAGLLIAEGKPWLIEFNVRLGDPETQPLLAIVEGDWGEALAQAAAGKLATDALRVSGDSALSVVLAAAGYPQSPRLGDAITGLDAAEAVPGVRVHHAGTRLEGGQVLTAGGRVLAVTARAPSFIEAHRRAYEAVSKIQFAGMQYRSDIGGQALTREAGQR